MLAIIAILLGLLLPAVHRARESARRTQCQSNLHQMAIAMVHFVETRKRLPDANLPGTIGGWAIAILPFMEDTNLANGLSENPPLDPTQPLALARKRPPIMSCPSAYEGDSNIATVPPSHYGASSKRNDRKPPWTIGELPTNSRIPWVTSPEGGIGGEESLRLRTRGI